MDLDKLEPALLTELVEDIAKRELMTRFQRVGASKKSDGSVITEADLVMQSALTDALQAAFPEVPLLGEEMTAEAQARLLADSGKCLWCLDPLDGTGNFAAGIPVFSVSLALLREGRAVAGVVHDPVRQETFSAVRGRGAWLNGEPLRVPEAMPSALSDATGLVDFKRLPRELAMALAIRPPYRSQRSFGSVALDWCWLAMGRCHLYVHGGQKLWDYAAGSLILSEAGGAGGLCEDYQGTPQQRVSLMPKIGLAATSEDLLGLWRTWINNRTVAP